MAGTKLVSYPHSLGENSYGSRTNLGRNMEEDDVLNDLNDKSFNKRADILDKLRGLARRNGGRLPFDDKVAIFKGLSLALSDNNWDVRHKCIQLIHESIPSLQDERDECMRIVFPKLIPNLGDSKITIRRAVIQTLHVCMQHTDNVQQIFKAIIRYGLDNPEYRIKKEVVVALPMLFTPDFATENLYEITQCLAKRLLDSDAGEESLHRFALLSMEKIKGLVGDVTFNSYIQRLSAPLRKHYYRLSGNEPYETSSPSVDSMHGIESNHTTSYNSGANTYFEKPVQYDTFKSGYARPAETGYEFGVIPSHVMGKVTDQQNWGTRAKGVEELKLIIKEVGDISPLIPNLLQFISFLNNLLDDSNFKITTVTLEILGLLVTRLHYNIKPHLKPVIVALTKRMGENKIVMRQAIMKVVMQLMQILSPKPVLSVICENLSHRNSKVRQETLNIAIASLLTFPSYDFDLGSLCQTIAPTLVDPKRQVRQAALECFSVLAQAMGAGKLQPLVQAVDSVELSYDGDGVMAAVQSKLARRQLPKLNADGLVDYATPLPGSATGRGGSSIMAPGADIDWILSAASGSSNSSSARSNRSEMMDVMSVNSSARSTPTHMDPDSPTHGPTPRVRASSGRAKQLPWERENAENGDSSLPPKQPNSDPGRKTKLNSLKPGGPPSSRDKSPETVGYKQIYMNKYKRQMSADGAAQPFSKHNPPSKDTNDDVGPSYLQSREDMRTNFSQSWPDSRMFEEGVQAVKPNKRILDPIGTDRGNDQCIEMNEGKDSAPIPTKATLVRGTSSRVSASRRVPPIPAVTKLEDSSRRVPGESARDSGLSGMIQEQEEPNERERDASLRQIRNSASKKQVEKLWSQAEARESRTPSPNDNDPLEESGIFSNFSTLRSNTDETDSSRSKQSSKKENPFESRPRLARKNSVQTSKTDLSSKSNTPQDSVRSNIQSDSVAKFDFRPIGGVTFRENNTADLAMVGKGYSEDARPVEPKPSQVAQKARERRRVGKSLVSPLSMANTNTYGAQPDSDDENAGLNAVVGRGMFDNVPPSPTDHSSPNFFSSGTRERKTSTQDVDPRDLPRGVYGIGVKQGSQDKPSSDEEYEYEEEEQEAEDVDHMAMSAATKERLADKIKQRQEEAEQMRLETERVTLQREQEKEMERQKEIQKVKERQQEKLRQLSANSGNSDTRQETLSVGSTPPTNRSPSKQPPKPKKRPSENSLGNGHIKPAPEPEVQDVKKPFKDPYRALDEASKNLHNDQWETKCEGLTMAHRLAIHHPEVLCGGSTLHNLTVQLIQEVKNLRSQVSRQAIQTFGEMFISLKKNMDTDLDMTTKVLLLKAGEANQFIRTDAENALFNMIDNCTPQRALNALINGGASHKNNSIRNCASTNICTVVERMGPGRVLSGIKDITDKILPIASHFILDASPETRYNGQRIFYNLMNHEDFERTMKKHVDANTLRNVQDKLDSLKKRGLPSETPSAGTRRSGQGSRSGSSTRGNSAASGMDNAPAPRRKGVRTDEATMESIKSMIALLSANDFRERQRGINQLAEMVRSNPNLVSTHVVKIFDKFVPCLKDSNSKVNLQALQVLADIIEPLRDSLSSVINIVVQTVAQNISSRNKEIHEVASVALDNLMDHVEGSMLLQPFCNQVQQGNARIKPDMIDRVAFLVQNLYNRKSKQVILHVLPLLWHLLSSSTGSGAVQGGTGSIRTATVSLVHSLYSQLGQTLLDHAHSNSNVTPRMQQTLQDMIENP